MLGITRPRAVKVVSATGMGATRTTQTTCRSGGRFTKEPEEIFDRLA